MKTYCTTCGCHFPEDFQETMEPECTFWSSRGFPVEFENREKWLQEIWTAMFSVDADAMANECKVAITLLDLKAYTNIQAVDDGVNQFEEHVPGYKDWDDEKRKRFQKAWIYLCYDFPRLAFLFFVNSYIRNEVLRRNGAITEIS